MGRTVMPISRAIEEEFQSWGKFRRALRKEDQEALEAMFCAAKFHVAAAAYASRLSPLEAILVSVLLEHQKALTRLERQLAQKPVAVIAPIE